MYEVIWLRMANYVLDETKLEVKSQEASPDAPLVVGLCRS